MPWMHLNLFFSRWIIMKMFMSGFWNYRRSTHYCVFAPRIVWLLIYQYSAVGEAETVRHFTPAFPAEF